jgi:hypothetical protein
MSELHVRQIKAALEKHFAGVVDISDLAIRPVAEQTTAFLTRAQLAFVFSYLSGVPADVAAAAITDGFGDNGLDGVLYNATERVLYIGQSKWRHDGTGSIERGDIQKFIKGFRDLINARWSRFNQKMQPKAPDVEAALNDSSTRIVLVVTYTGQNALSTEVSQDLADLLEDVNNPTELVTTQVLRQSNIYAAVAQGIQGAPIDEDVQLFEWGWIREPYEAVYGQVAAADVARWYEHHQSQLFVPNIRMFLGATEVNTTIIETLRDVPREFWYFNNGISALCRTIKKKPIGGSTRETGTFECRDLRIVNGAQTVGAIFDASQKHSDKVALARVPIRLVSLEHCPPEFDKKVTRYNNTQNRIDRRDFVALDLEQERIRGELLLEGVSYVYKSGETLTPSAKGFGLEEATVARACSQADVNLAVQAKREIGKLWEDIDKAPYKILFNPSVSGPTIWRAVQIVREVEATLANLKTQTGRDRLLAVHGNRFIAHLVFQCLPAGVVAASGQLDATVRNQVAMLTEHAYNSALTILDAKYPDAYLANLFKNAGKCQTVKDHYACP